MTERMVACRKLGKEAPGLTHPPTDDELGKEIFENISQEAWSLWTDQMMVRVINEYRLNLADPEQYRVFIDEMRAFLNLTGPQLAE